MRLVGFIRRIKYTISNGIVIVTHEISYNLCNFTSIFIYVIRDREGNNNNTIANCILYLLRKSNESEDGS